MGTLSPDVLKAIAALGPESLFEIVNGQVIEKPPINAFAQSLATEIGFALETYARSQGLGRACVEMLFDLRPAFDRQPRPHVAFISVERWPLKARAPKMEAWAVVPNLVVEIVGPLTLAADLLNKIDEYFQAGVRLVWIVYSKHSRIYVYESLDSIRIFDTGMELDGGAILPGFRLSICELFDEPSAAL